MKSTTFARLALFLPYLILLESVVYFIFYNVSEKGSLLQTFNIAWNFLAIFWSLPYTILVIILLAQSKGKSFEDVKRIFLSAPLRLMFIAPASYIMILSIGSIINRNFFESSGRLLLFAAAVSVPASLLLGYAFLGISLLLLKLLLKIGIIKHADAQHMDLEIQNQQSPS
jgi:hypothetical protein